ncbi:unnamed protein product [Prorocentrum cordatum]|uniref:Dynein heavy chain linker domain-containing protein n=1 Tax=Prorocentrum cordatum TaxID=2364126 RepID=A0ABN9PDE6_9DINO|nr:unnamed protein product [Polarella glacialis]
MPARWQRFPILACTGDRAGGRREEEDRGKAGDGYWDPVCVLAASAEDGACVRSRVRLSASLSFSILRALSEALLGWDPSEFEKLQEGIDKLQPYDDLWKLVEACGQADKKWMRGPLFQIEPEAVDQAGLPEMGGRLHVSALFDNMQPPLPTPAGVAKKIKKDLDSFKQHLPLIHALCNPGLRQRHWDSISEAVARHLSWETVPLFEA